MGGVALGAGVRDEDRRRRSVTYEHGVLREMRTTKVRMSAARSRGRRCRQSRFRERSKAGGAASARGVFRPEGHEQTWELLMPVAWPSPLREWYPYCLRSSSRAVAAR